MNGQTLQTLRLHLMLSVAEAANYIGNVEERNWKNMELYEQDIPEKIEIEVRKILAKRREYFDEGVRLARNARNKNKQFVMVYYPALEDWIFNQLAFPAIWRAHCSAMAGLAAELDVKLIQFNKDHYSFWLNGREDTLALRFEWANS